MLWVAAFLALIIWVLGLASDFLGLRIHLFLLFAILCCLAALLPNRGTADEGEEQEDAASEPAALNAKSMPGIEDDRTRERHETAAIE
jgi:hypothetical protein